MRVCRDANMTAQALIKQVDIGVNHVRLRLIHCPQSDLGTINSDFARKKRPRVWARPVSDVMIAAYQPRP